MHNRNNEIPKYNDPMPDRKLFSFQKPEVFWERVHDRLHTVVERYVFQSKDSKIRENNKIQFTIILNAIPRDSELGQISINLDRTFDTKYPSAPTQRMLIEQGQKVLELDSHWEVLSTIRLDNSATIGPKLWGKVANKSYCFSDVLHSADTLENYFSVPRAEFSKSKISEEAILDYYFYTKSDIKNKSARYVAIPLIQFGEIDGFAYVIYEDEAHTQFNEANIKDLVTGFSIEYEGVILAWDLAFEDYERSYAFREIVKLISADDNEAYFADKSPILKDLGFPEYYRNHRNYFEDRFDQHTRILTEKYDQLILYGSTAILLDSFAHNISAHALTTLTWIFKNRAKLRIRDEQYIAVMEKMKDAAKAASEIANWANRAEGLKKSAQKRFKAISDTALDDLNYHHLIDYKGSLMREIAPFFKFLQEKGGFWSGLTRDDNIGGQINTLYSILFYDFIYNALYLGTIAESENIRKLKINITLYQETLVDVKNDTNFVRKLPLGEAKHFATIDLGGKEVAHTHHLGGKNGASLDGGDWYIELPKGERIWYEQLQGLEGLSRFVQLGDDFWYLEKKMREIRLFFPGSIVGKHALFTMIENELRNIKHYFGKNADAPTKRDEMTLNISLQPASLGKNNSVELYQVGLWLGFTSPLKDEKRQGKDQYLVKRRFDMLWDEVLYEGSKQPRLGGNSQDKVCAAMLFNSSFSSVQRGSFRALALLEQTDDNLKRRDAIFYPWITPAVCFDNCDQEFRVPAAKADFDIESSYNKITGGVDYKNKVEDFKTEIIKACDDYHNTYGGSANGMGVLKKYIYVWKGEAIRTHYEQDEMALDHLGRFKFVVAERGSAMWQMARDNGVIRIVNNLDRENGNHENKNEDENLQRAYHKWFEVLFGGPIDINFYNADQEGVLSSCLHYMPYSDVPLVFTSQSLEKNEGIKFISNGPEIRRLLDENAKKSGHRNAVTYNLTCAHNIGSLEKEIVRYRRHGVIYQHFMPDAKVDRYLSLDNIPTEKMFELFEFIATRICLFDNRLFNRTDQTRLDYYQNTLNLFFCPEAKIELKNSKASHEWGDADCENEIRKCHFLVMHLSFIDRLLQDKHGNSESNMGMFIEKEIMPLVGKPDGSGLKDNFVLVVTTGRGRQNWRESFNKPEYEKYKPNVIFRPIESLISAMEDSLMLGDDFDLKFRLVKALFGS